MARGNIRKAMNMGKGAPTNPQNHVAFVPEKPQDRGQASRSSRISRVGSTARKTGSGAAGGTL